MLLLRQRRPGGAGKHLRHEHLAPATVFSVAAFSQLQFKADCFPHEHLAWLAQTQLPSERPQQVVGTVILNTYGIELRMHECD